MDYSSKKNGDELKKEIKNIVDLILSDYDKGRDIDQLDVFNQPDRDAVKDIVIKLLRIIYPGYSRDKIYKSYNDSNRIAIVIEDVIYNMQGMRQNSLQHGLNIVNGKKIMVK